MPLQCDARHHTQTEQPRDRNPEMPSLSSITLFSSLLSLDIKRKVLGCFEGGWCGRAPWDLQVLGKLTWEKSRLGDLQWVCVLAGYFQSAGRKGNGCPPCSPSWPLYAQGLHEDPRLSCLQASLSLTLRMLRSFSAKHGKRKARCFTQACFSALVESKETIS